jgi:competence protein ComEA
MSAELPPRPEPPRRLGDTVQAWFAWIGMTRLIVTALCVVVVVGGVAWLVRAPAASTESGLPFTSSVGSAPPTAATLAPPATVASTLPTVETGPVFVHVAGSVAVPGVYGLEPGDRVHQAIAAAGGPSAEADLDGLNLALVVTDGQRVYVPAAGEVDPASVPSGAQIAVDPAANGEPVVTGPLDLNTATAAELDTLPGVGPATAAAIVDDRERHGPFAAVGDLERVPGIGPAKLAAIADQVTV